jgi:two-component system heavy metal sensor histidine kinase CusS
MSSKSDDVGPNVDLDTSHWSRSLAARLTFWYAGSSFLLVVLATSYLYWAMVNNVNREDDALLGDKVRVVQAVLQQQPNDVSAIRQEVEDTWRARENERTYVRVIDESGHVLIESPTLRDAIPPGSFPVPTDEPGRGTDVRVDENRRYRLVSVREPGSTWTVQLAMDRGLEGEILTEYLAHLWYVLGVALIACAGAGYVIAHRGVRPIQRVTEITRRIGPTNLTERVSCDGLPAELRKLAATFNGMLDQLEQSFARLSRFSADIAHELRTPVATLRGQVEVALSKLRSPDEYREILQSNLEDCTRLAHIIDRLLFLARAENPEQEVTKEPCDLQEELITICDFYDAAATDAGVKLLTSNNGSTNALVDRVLLQRAVGNLIANAIAHTPAGGSVTVSARETENSALVEVSDTGIGIDASHLPHVFDRLYRADNSRASGTGGVGLGLAIVRTIAHMHGGGVDISSAVGQGTTVSIRFPRAASRSAATENSVAAASRR